VVTVTRIDRLARSTFDLFGIVKRIVDAKAQFRSLAEPWADTGTSTGRLSGCGLDRAPCRLGLRERRAAAPLSRNQRQHLPRPIKRTNREVRASESHSGVTTPGALEACPQWQS
jgi:hypothetical protein